MSKYILYCGLSGCLWGAIAFAISNGVWGSSIIGGLAAAPLIGIVIGLLFLPAYRLSSFWQFFLSLITLYLGAALFGIGIGLYTVLGGNAISQNAGDVIIQTALTILTGLTLSYWFIILWPLSYLNHQLLNRVVWKKTLIGETVDSL